MKHLRNSGTKWPFFLYPIRMTFNKDYIIIGLIFSAALFYIVRKVYNAFFAKKEGCDSGCGCAATELKKSKN